MEHWKFILKVVLCASFVLVYLVDAHRNKMQSWNDFLIEPVYLSHAQQNAGVLYLHFHSLYYWNRFSIQQVFPDRPFHEVYQESGRSGPLVS